MSTTPSRKTITLNLSDFIDILMGPKDFVFPERHISELLRVLDTESLYVHVQEPDKDNGLHIPKVWRIVDWRVDIERQKIVKEDSNKRVELWNEQKKIQDEISTAYQVLGLDESTADSMARTCIQTKNWKMAKNLGIDVSKFLALQEEMKKV